MQRNFGAHVFVNVSTLEVDKCTNSIFSPGYAHRKMKSLTDICTTSKPIKTNKTVQAILRLVNYIYDMVLQEMNKFVTKKPKTECTFLLLNLF